MALLKCKMCGGSLKTNPGESTATCEYCGTTQTIPKTGDESTQNLFNRANELRSSCEFDRAEQVYEKILELDNGEAEAHWGLLLCRYGIEYVTDPMSGKKIPTCHRASYDPILTDVDYLAAVELGGQDQKSLYTKEAKQISTIQENILRIAKDEAPFDVFICYKETDENGKRTPDSVLANDIYHQLDQEGYKVFYAPITLEDKLGVAYEPYIFAALHSAKVMLVIGTKPEYFSAVWVKNEWGRFLRLAKKDRSKLLIPCYRDMDPYDLPQEFAHLQAQDIAKLGFIPDLIRGIKKLVTVEQPQQQESAAPLLRRAFLFLEDGDWQKADAFCEQVLNTDPECAEAYLGKLMAERRVQTQDQLQNGEIPLQNSSNYQKILRFGEEELKNTLQEYNRQILLRMQNAKTEDIYLQANRTMEHAQNIKAYQNAIALLQQVSHWKDAPALIEECQNRIAQLEEKQKQAAEQAQIKREQQEAAAKHKRKIAGKVVTALLLTTVVCVACYLVYATFIRPSINYKNAVSMMEAGEYLEAYNIFKELGSYTNAESLAQQCAYSAGLELEQTDKLAAAIAFGKAGSYQDAAEKSWTYWQEYVEYTTLDCGYAHVVAILENGTAVGAGRSKEGQIDLDGWQDLVSISAGSFHTVGLKKDGTVVATGENSREECNVSQWKNIVAVAAGDNFTVGLKTDGTVVATGDIEEIKKELSKWTDIVSIDADYHVAGVKVDGTVVATGQYVEYGECEVGSMQSIRQIEVGGWHTVGITENGTAVAVGRNSEKQLAVSGWTDLIDVENGSVNTIGLKSDGTLVTAGESQLGELDVSEWTDIVAVSIEHCTTVGLKSDGTVLMAGEYIEGMNAMNRWKNIRMPKRRTN